VPSLFENVTWAMSAGEFLDLEGRLSRVCPKCRVEISVVRPPRPLSAATSAKARRRLGAELRRQVLFDALGDCECRQFWNDLIMRCEEGVKPKRRTAA
jgi:hypothetical protein